MTVRDPEVAIRYCSSCSSTDRLAELAEGEENLAGDLIPGDAIALFFFCAVTDFISRAPSRTAGHH